MYNVSDFIKALNFFIWIFLVINFNWLIIVFYYSVQACCSYTKRTFLSLTLSLIWWNKYLFYFVMPLWLFLLWLRMERNVLWVPVNMTFCPNNRKFKFQTKNWATRGGPALLISSGWQACGECVAAAAIGWEAVRGGEASGAPRRRPTPRSFSAHAVWRTVSC